MTLQEMFLGNVYVVLIVTGVFTGISVVMLMYGITLSRRATVPPRLRESWQRYVIPFLGSSGPDAVDADALRVAEPQWWRLQSGSAVGGSVGTLIGAAGMAAVIIAAARAPFGLPVAVTLLLFAPLHWGLLAGSLLGYAVTSRRRASGVDGDGLTDGEPSRRVSDYRSPLVLLVATLPFVFYSTLTLILAPRFVAFSPAIAREYGIVEPPRWILAIYPCVGLVTLILAEICVWVRVKLGATIRLQDAALARRLHTGVTGQFVGTTYEQAMFLSTLMGGAVIQLFSLALNGAGFAVCMGITLALFAVSLWMQFPANQSRLGGRLTGWPWSGHGAAAARGDGVV